MSNLGAFRARRRSPCTLLGVFSVALVAVCAQGSVSGRSLLQEPPVVQEAGGASTQDAGAQGPGLPPLRGLPSLPDLPFFGLPPLPAVDFNAPLAPAPSPEIAAAPSAKPLPDMLQMAPDMSMEMPRMAPAVAPASVVLAPPKPTDSLAAVSPSAAPAMQPLVEVGPLPPALAQALPTPVAETLPTIPLPVDFSPAPAPDVANLNLPAVNVALSPVAAVLADVANGPAPAVSEAALPPISIPLTVADAPMPPQPPQPVADNTADAEQQDGPPRPPMPPRPPLPGGVNSYLQVLAPEAAPAMAPMAEGGPTTRRHLLQEGPPEPIVNVVYAAEPPLPPLGPLSIEAGPPEPSAPLMEAGPPEPNSEVAFAPFGADMPTGMPLPPGINSFVQLPDVVGVSKGRKLLMTEAAPAPAPIAATSFVSAIPDGPPEIPAPVISFLSSAAKNIFQQLAQPYVGAGRRLTEDPAPQPVVANAVVSPAMAPAPAAVIPALSPMVMPESIAGPPQPAGPGGPFAPNMAPQPGPQPNGAQPQQPPQPALPPSVVAFFQTTGSTLLSKLTETLGTGRRLSEEAPMAKDFYVASPVMAPATAPAVAAEVAPLSPMPAAQPMTGPPRPTGPQPNGAGPPQPGFAAQPQNAPMPQQQPPALPPAVTSFFQTAGSAIMSNLAQTFSGATGRRLDEQPSVAEQLPQAVAMDGPPKGALPQGPVLTDVQPLSQKAADYLAPTFAALAPTGAELLSQVQSSGQPELIALPAGPMAPGMAPQPNLPAQPLPLPPAVNSFFQSASSALASNFASSFKSLGRKMLEDGPPQGPQGPQGPQPPRPLSSLAAQERPALPPGLVTGAEAVAATQSDGSVQNTMPGPQGPATLPASAMAPQPESMTATLPEPARPAGPESNGGPQQPPQGPMQPMPNMAGPPQPGPLPEAPAVGPQPMGAQPQGNFGPQLPPEIAAPPALANLAGQVTNFVEGTVQKSINSAVQTLLG